MSSPRPQNLADYVTEAARRRPDKIALVFGADRLTWADTEKLVNQVTSGLLSSGLTDGDRVGLVLGNRPEFVLAYFGVLRAGLVAVPLNPGFTTSEIDRMLVHAGVRMVIADSDSIDAVRAAGLGTAQRVVVGTAVAGEATFADLMSGADPGSSPEYARGGEDLAVILYTSGTSGDPKGAMLTHRALRSSIEQVGALGAPLIDPDDTVLVVLPLAHIYSLNGTLGAVVRQAATAVLVHDFDVVDTLRLVSQQSVTNIPGAPSLWSAWSEQPGLAESMVGVRLLFNGSDALSPRVQRRIKQVTALDVHEGYGLTEAAPGVSSTIVAGVVKPGSVGRPFPGVDVRLVDEDGQDVDAEEHDPGEIWIRGENLFSGYWPDGDEGPNEEGWYATGDIAFADEDGDLHLVDRRKDLVIVNGFNVYPREVEEVLLDHPSIVEAAVVGVPDERSGEQVKAYVVTAPGGFVDPTDVAEFCGHRLARFKRPGQIEVVARLPHSLTGKVTKGRLGHDD